jgi:hypothetical protein
MDGWRGTLRGSAAVFGFTLAVMVAVPGVASAAPSSFGAVTCHGGSVVPGTYKSLKVTGICAVDAGNVQVRGDVTVATGGGLNAGFGHSNITIGGDLVVRWKGLLVLGCEPVAFVCENDPDQSVGTYLTHDKVGGSLLSTGATLVVVHASKLGSVIQSGGGGGVTCNLFPLGPSGPPAYTDYEDNVIWGNASIVGVHTCWSGFIRDRVGGSVTYSGNLLADPDANEVVTNVIRGNLVCTGNSPKVQVGDSGGSPNKVGGKALGQCAHIT